MKERLGSIFDFLHQVEKFKSTLRYPTTTSGRKESSAEHTWRLSLMAFLIAEELKLEIDVFRAVKIALVHDLAEAVAGDFCSFDIARGKLSKQEKERAEREGMEKLRRLLPKDRGDEIYFLWEEYEQQETDEAKYIKALDKIETLIQFTETGYQIVGDADEHLAFYADNQVRNFPQLREVLKLVKKELKREYQKGEIPWKEEYDSFQEES